MEVGLFWEAKSCPASREIPLILCSQKVHHHVHKSPLLNLILNQVNEVNLLTLSFYEINLLLDSHPSVYLYISDFTIKILHAFVVFLMRAARAAQFILFNSIMLTIICGQLPF
jgi:hypothetical protein